MAKPNGLRDLTWDSASCARFVLGRTRVPFTKISVPKVETKVEKVPRIGEPRATKRTPGRTEVADLSAELLLTDWEESILPAFNRHGSNLIQFCIIGSVSHPSINGSYNTLLDQCRIVSEEGPEFDGSEKGLIYKLGISVMNVWRKGRDGIWKCSSFEPTLPSALADALIRF